MKKLSSREREVLSLLIGEYIATASPVGSSSSAFKNNLEISPATIRNVLAGLEEVGLLTHPHTSAGRIPTAEGLRYYVDTIVKKNALSENEQKIIREQFHETGKSTEDAIKRTAAVLSLVSQYTGLIVMPKMENTTFKHIEFLPLSEKRILGIFVSREGIVTNRVMHVEQDFSYSELEKITNYCNRVFYGLTIEEAAHKAHKEFEETKTQYDKLIVSALVWSKEIFEDAKGSELVVEGGSKLFNAPEFTNIEKLKQVMSILEEKKMLLHLMNRAAESEDVRIFIGSESGVDAVSDCSIVSMPYKKGEEVLGTVGIIGPTRMDYSRVIPVVDFTAKLVSDMLAGR